MRNIVRIDEEKCNGCGECARECAQKAIKSDEVQFQILVGGGVGRHPRGTQELCGVDGSCVVKVVERFLERLAQRACVGV